MRSLRPVVRPDLLPSAADRNGHSVEVLFIGASCNISNRVELCPRPIIFRSAWIAVLSGQQATLRLWVLLTRYNHASERLRRFHVWHGIRKVPEWIRKAPKVPRADSQHMSRDRVPSKFVYCSLSSKGLS